MQGSEGTGKDIVRLIVGAELTRTRVLDQITFGPGLGSRHTGIHISLRSRQIEVGGYPVPTGLQIDLLPFATTGGQHQRFIRTATVNKTVGKEDILTRLQVIDLTGRSLPEQEADLLAVHRIVTEDSQVDIGRIADIVERYIRLSHAFVMVDGIDDIAFVRIVSAVHQYLGADGHIKRIQTFVHIVVRRHGLDGIFDMQRFAQSVFVRQINDIAVLAYRRLTVEGQPHLYFAHRVNRTVGLINREPRRQGLDRVLMAFAAVVDDTNEALRIGIGIILTGDDELFLGPFETVAIDEGGPGHR